MQAAQDNGGCQNDVCLVAKVRVPLKPWACLRHDEFDASTDYRFAVRSVYQPRSFVTMVHTGSPSLEGPDHSNDPLCIFRSLTVTLEMLSLQIAAREQVGSQHAQEAALYAPAVRSVTAIKPWLMTTDSNPAGREGDLALTSFPRISFWRMRRPKPHSLAGHTASPVEKDRQRRQLHS
jgi:hypothetical protein